MVQGFFTYKSGLEATEKLLARKRIPTAIFASNDDMAAAAISVAHRRGLDVPSDLSVVGFDDTPIATTVWPELTTIRQPIAAMAEAAINLLLHKIRRPKDRHVTQAVGSPRPVRAGQARFGRAAAQALSVKSGRSRREAQDRPARLAI